MSPASISKQSRKSFFTLSKKAFDQLQGHEELTISFRGENTAFFRFNKGAMRQATDVQQNQVTLIFISAGEKMAEASFELTGEKSLDEKELTSKINFLRKTSKWIPKDPFCPELPGEESSSEQEFFGELLPHADIPKSICHSIKGLDFAGLYTQGLILAGTANSKGNKQWFATESFIVDYSLYTEDQRAVSGVFSGKSWDPKAWSKHLALDAEKLELLKKPQETLAPGKYRVYLAPGAVAELLGTMSWQGLSEGKHQREYGPLTPMRKGEKTWSSSITLSEDFNLGLCPRFNSLGQMASPKTELITSGVYKQAICNDRTSKEYKVPSNGANDYEIARSLNLHKGDLPETDVLATLGTGVYLSNLHYLNWSDFAGGRVTGMTRFACFWVENGKILAPIKDMRFDDSIPRIFSDGLEAVTDRAYEMPDLSSYGHREMGGMKCPGMIINDFNFAL